LVAVTAEFLVDSIDGLTSSGSINKEFVGVILLPIVGNAAEHVTAVTVSVKDKLTLSLGVAVGSSIVSSLPQTWLLWRLTVLSKLRSL
jgi:Ca2+:H+ antiporter